MSKVSHLSFRYYIFTPTGRRLHASELRVTVEHTSFSDLMEKVQTIVDERIGILGAISIYTVPNNEQVHDWAYENVFNKGHLSVLINNVVDISMG